MWYVLTQSGFDRTVQPAAQAQGLEVLREVLDDAGKPITTLKLGQEVTVRLRVRALGSKAWGDVAITDLLPGGFEAVLQPPPPAPVTRASAGDDHSDEGDSSQGDSEAGDGDSGDGDGNGESSAGDGGGDAAPGAGSRMPPLALPGSTFVARHLEVREDRVVLYGQAGTAVTEIRYRIRANNVGRFALPPIVAESMYDRRVFARGPGGVVLQVLAPAP